jgi:hypothetical protein
MENSGTKSSSYVGSMVHHKPTSHDQHFETTNYLLSLLPGEKMSETLKESIKELKGGELLQNVPNPFNGSTHIYYKLETEYAVEIDIYNYTGQKIKTYNEGMKSEGVHSIGFSAANLPNGIYFYSIRVNGKLADSKKMTIVK